MSVRFVGRLLNQHILKQVCTPGNIRITVSVQMMHTSYSGSKCSYKSVVSNINNYQKRSFSEGASSNVQPDEDDIFLENESAYEDIDYDKITEGDPEKLKLLKVLQLEVDVMYQQGDEVPSYLNTEEWIELLSCVGRTGRVRFLRFLWTKEVRKQNKKKRKESEKVESKRLYEEIKKNISKLKEEKEIVYGLNNNTLFHRIYENEVNRLYNYYLMQAMMYGDPILIDCGYNCFMSRKEISNCAKQLLFLFSENRVHPDPFHVIFCNVDPNDSSLFSKVHKTIPCLYDDDFPFTFTSKNYLDLYPKERLVYLTPHCNAVLNDYNSNDVYIVGAMVDKSHCEPLSLAKAKRDGIRVAKFPLDNYLSWACGGKSLTLNQVVNIMNDIKTYRDWNIALQHIPKRKLLQDPIDRYSAEKKKTNMSAKMIREKYRRNLVYDLILNERLTRSK